MLLSTPLFSADIIDDPIIGDEYNLKPEQNKKDSLLTETINFVDTTHLKKKSDSAKDSAQLKPPRNSARNDLYPAVGKLDKAFLVANDFCTHTLTKWDEFFQRMLTKINSKLKKSEDKETR